MHTAVATALSIRPLTREDLPAVVAIDAALAGRTRRTYIEQRLAAALREPALHAQFAAQGSNGLAGYILARVLEGEFGRTEPGVRLEMVGVRADLLGQRVGRLLFDTLLQWARRHGIRDVRTAALWRETPMLGWLDKMGFELAPDLMIDCAVDGGAYRPERDAPVAELQAEAAVQEINFAEGTGNDFEKLARDTAEVGSMTPADLDAIVRIDRGIVGHDRRGYIAARLEEAMNDSAVRVSLIARRDGATVGYLMARADLGDFGRVEPVAVIDTLGVDPDYAHRGVGHALLSQLFANLGGLRVERVETVVAQRDLSLLDFFYGCGFAPSERLSFVRQVAKAG